MLIELLYAVAYPVGINIQTANFPCFLLHDKFLGILELKTFGEEM